MTAASRRRQSAIRNPQSAIVRRRPFFEPLENRQLLALVSYWSGDNTAIDPVSGNNGTLYNGATYVAGQVGQAYSFDGVDDRLGVADAPSLALTGSITIEAWVKANSYPAMGTGHGLILFRGDDRGGLDPYQLTLQQDGALKFQVNSLTAAASVAAPMPLGEFVHVAGTLDDATGAMRLYMNGVLVSQTQTTVRPFGALDSASNPGVGIGSHGGYPTTPHRFLFSGLIDELKLYDNALTQAEVIGIFDAGKGSLQPKISIDDRSATEGQVSTYLDDVFVERHSGGLTNAHQAVFGPSGDLFVASGDTDSVLKYSGTTGDFVAAVIPAGTFGLDVPWGMVFGPDGKLYVAGRNSDNILRYDPLTQQIDEFIAPGSGLWAPVGMAFGADGQLYVANSDRGTADTSLDQDQVRRFAGPAGGPNSEQPGTFLNVFVAAGAGGTEALDNPNQLAFSGSYLYVTNTRGDSINRYDASSGTFDRVFVTRNSGGLDVPNHLFFHSDGLLYVASQGTGQVLRYSGASGAFVDVFAAPPTGIAAGNPNSIAVGSDGLFYVPYGGEVLRYGVGQVAQFAISLSAPFPTAVSVSYDTADGSAAAGSDYTAAAGSVTFAPGEWRKIITVPTLDDAALESTENFTVNLSNASGGTIADAQGVGTILDDDASRQITINDVTVNEGGSPHFRQVFVPRNSAGLVNPRTPLFHNGMLYVLNESANSVIRYNATTGEFIDNLIGPNPELNGGLSRPMSMAFGPDGNLYIVTYETNQVLRYDGMTGEFIDTFVTSGSGGLSFASDLAFDGAGNLYVTTDLSAQVLRYDPNGNPFPGPLGGPGNATFVPSNSGSLTGARGIVFDGNGNLLVASIGNDKVLKYSGGSGAFISEFVTAGEGGLDQPHSLALGPDGYLYVGSVNLDAVFRYSGTSGNFIDVFPTGSGGLDNPFGMMFDSAGRLYVASGFSWEILQFSAEPEAMFTVSLAAAVSTPVSVSYSTADGSAAAGSDYSAAAGSLTFAPGEWQKIITVPTLDDTALESNETFTVNLSNASGGTIADAQGIGTILDDEAARQISISDATTAEGNQIHSRGLFVEGLPSAHFIQVAFGPDGNVYTAVGTGDGYNTIRRYDGTTGDFLGTFIGQGYIDGVRDILFRGGYMYVAAEYSDKVLRFDASTGAFVDTFVAAGSGGINGPHGMAFGPDANGDGVGELYVSGRDGQHVVRFDGVTGQPLGTYVTPGSGGLSWPEGITFDPSGTYLFVASTGSSRILKYNAQTGAYLGVAASTNLSGPKDVKFGPDGLMYVASGGNDRIVRFTAAGTYVDDYVPAGTAGLDNPSRLAFQGNDLFVTSAGNSQIFQFGTQAEAIFDVSLAAATNIQVTVDFATADGTALAGSDYVATTGTVSFAAGATRRVVRIPLQDDSVFESTETFVVNLSSPSPGSAIVDPQATGTIIDNDPPPPPPTKFFVVNDGSPDRTYEYGANGAAVENYAINSGNTAPRGAASTAAGDKVWVVDANKHVYVYDNSGGLLGSWTAGSLPSNASVQGVTTNGTDVWIVDDKGNKVYRYAGAASRLSGSQNAASSFTLNGSNGNPSDLVTDGASIWVVNNATGWFSTDKVFKYTIGGSLLGSWTINSGGGSPTGITIDPASASNIWIVDNSSDRVYQFDAAASRTSGSQSPSTSFALSAGNTNPQGIADPPPVSTTGFTHQGHTKAAGHSAPSAESFDSALLSVVGELDDLLAIGKKKK